jgi:hypothetical protein
MLTARVQLLAGAVQTVMLSDDETAAADEAAALADDEPTVAAGDEPAEADDEPAAAGGDELAAAVPVCVDRNDGVLGEGLTASAIAIPAPAATARPRTAGSSHRGPRRRRAAAAVVVGEYGAGWAACVAGAAAGAAGGVAAGGSGTGVNSPDSSTADTEAGQNFPGAISG